MKPGDQLEVNQIWASQGATRPPLTHWFKGYRLVSRDGDKVVVEKTDGTRLNFALRDVRLENE